MNLKHLRASLPATMAGLASQANLKLAFGSPSTDGKTIWVSDIPLNPTREEYFLVVSDLIHEIGHILYTNFNLVKDGPLGCFINVFEDIRIEREVEKRFLGAKTFLDEGYKFTTKNSSFGIFSLETDALFKAPRPESSAEAKIESLLFFLSLKYQIEVNKRNFFIPAFKATQNKINTLFSKDVLKKVITLCNLTVPNLSSTEDCLRLSEKVIKIISEDSSIKMESLDDDLKNPLSLRCEAEDACSVNRENSSKFFYGDSDDIAKNVGNVQRRSEDKFYYKSDIETDIEAYNVLKKDAIAEIQAFRRHLFPRWINQSRVRNVLNEDSGVFSIGAAINCLSSGEDKFLIKKALREDNKPAICLLADYSRSMNNEALNGGMKIDIQSKTMVALIEACHIANVPLNLLGFSNLIFHIKTWQDPIAKARGIIGGQGTIKGTMIVPAVFEAIRSFSSRKEKRKICIVLTDGEINSDEKALLNLMDYAKKYHPDIEFYGLGIDVNLSKIFPKGGKVSPEDISNTVLSILTE